MTYYRNTTLHADGTVTGEHSNHPERGYKPFADHLDLLWIHEACEQDLDCARSIWDIQDGYGTPGRTAPYGWDFTAVRNSSPEARQVMAAIAQRHLAEDALFALLRLPTATLRSA